MIRSVGLFCVFLSVLCFDTYGQDNDHIRGAAVGNLSELHTVLREGILKKDTNVIFEVSFDLLTYHSAKSNWDSIYYYNEKVAESALALGLIDKHLASYINNVSMDQMFRRNGESLEQRYNYLQKHLNDERVTTFYKSEIANMLAGKYYRTGEVDSVFHYQKMAIRFSDIEDDHQKSRVAGRIQLASYYREFGRSSEALQYLVEIESELENSLLPAMQKISFYSAMTYALTGINDLNRASEYLEKYKYHLEENEYNSLYCKYYHLEAMINIKRGDSRATITSLQLGIEGATKAKSKELIISLWTKLAREYHKSDNLDSMKIYIDSLTLYKTELNDRMKVNYNSLLHKSAMTDKDYPLAYKYLREINENYSHVKNADASVALLNNRYYERVGDVENAYRYFKKYFEITDSMRLVQNAAQAKSIEVRFNRDQQDAEINLLTATNTAQDKALAVRNNTILLGSIMLLLLSALLFGLYRLYKRNQETQKQLAVQNKQISKALEQNQILIKEIHHRVKNNLQVVSSLLSLQERKVDDQATKEALRSSQTRVQTMSLIHKSLYQKDDVRSIDIKNYFKQLTENLVSSFAINPVNLKLDIDELNIDIDSLVPLGLVANELICNALKHGIKDKKDGVLTVSLKSVNDKIVLSVEDDGGSLGKDHLIRKEGSLGTRLIHAFTDNLEGELDVKGGASTKISLTVDKNKITFANQ